MILKLYSVYDEKTQLYHPPNFCHNAGHATRMFTQLFKDPTCVFNQFPVDFRIYEIGEFNDETGAIKTYRKPTAICTGLDLIPNPVLPERREDELAQQAGNSEVS